MTADVGIDTHLPALRHYSATVSRLASTSAPSPGRLGHGGGGATTLRVYAAWLAAADKSAAGYWPPAYPNHPSSGLESWAPEHVDPPQEPWVRVSAPARQM